MPAVTDAQFAAIISEVASVAAEADTAGSRDILSSRFAGPALELRAATYTIRASYPEYAAPQPIPDGPVQVLLPQASTTWPKTVLAIVGDSDASDAPPAALFLRQETARSDYKVYYEIALEPDTSLPALAASSVGTTLVAPDSRLIAQTPEAVRTAYADILAVGDASQYSGLVDPAGDTLRSQVGVDYKNSARGGLSSTASIEFASADAAGQDIALSTSDSGALVAMNLAESTTVKPVESGATVSTEGAVKALSQITESAKGVQSVYDYQLLFYIPPSTGTDKRAQLLGFTQGLLSSAELP